MLSGLFGGEDAEEEVGFVVGSKRRRDDHVFAGFQAQPQRHFSRFVEHGNVRRRVFREPLLVQHAVHILTQVDRRIVEDVVAIADAESLGTEPIPSVVVGLLLPLLLLYFLLMLFHHELLLQFELLLLVLGNVVNGETDGMEVETGFQLSSPVLLHQGDDHRAQTLAEKGKYMSKETDFRFHFQDDYLRLISVFSIVYLDFQKH